MRIRIKNKESIDTEHGYILNDKNLINMDRDTLKYCPMCKEEKPLGEFNKNAPSPDGHAALCRECTRICNKRYSLTPKGMETIRKGHLRRTYKITSEDYQRILEGQGGKCKICGAEENPDTRAGFFVVDHNHTTGEIRGLLCTKCNALLGLAKEDPEILRRSIEYLKTG